MLTSCSIRTCNQVRTNDKRDPFSNQKLRQYMYVPINKHEIKKFANDSLVRA